MNKLIDQVLDEIRGAARFRWVAVTVAWCVCLVGWTVVFVLPDKYQATAKAFVDTRTALTPVLQGLAIQQDVNAQLSLVQQSILGGGELEKVAREAGLISPTTTNEAKSKVIEALRREVELGAQNSGGGTLFTIQYRDSSRERSLKVVADLLDSLVQDTLGGKREGSETAQKFLTDQIQDYEQRLRGAEQRLADFKKQNVGVMPGAEGDYFSRLQNEMDALKKAQTSLNIAATRREELSRQLHGELPITASTDKTTNPAITGSDVSQRIREAEANLEQLLLRFTDKHPDVIALRENLAQLKQRQVAELEAFKRGDPGAAANSGAASNPIYQSILLALNQVDVELAALRGDVADRERRIAELRRLVDTVPQVEAEYARLNRDYDVTRAQYSELVQRMERAKLGDQAETTGSIRFEIVDKPAASFQPVSPNRGLLLFAVLLAGIGAGAGVAYLLHHLKPVFNNSRVLHEITVLPVLGVVSMTWLDRHRVALRYSYLMCSALTAALLVCFAGVLKFNEQGARLLQTLMRLG